jgi:hypothetical protein
MKKIIGLVWILVLTSISFGQANMPESAAKGLFNAWKNNNRTEAAKYAPSKVIDMLWKETNAEYEFESCSKSEKQMHCWYRQDGGTSLNLTMIKTGAFWRVKSIIWVDLN